MAPCVHSICCVDVVLLRLQAHSAAQLNSQGACSLETAMRIADNDGITLRQMRLYATALEALNLRFD
jgi:hypothetical protein